MLGTATDQTVEALVEALTQNRIAEGMEHIHTALDSGADPRQLARQTVAYLRQVLLTKTNNADLLDVPAEARPRLARHAAAFSLPDLLRAIRAFDKAAAEARADWHPSLPLEIAFLEAAQQPPAAQSATAAPPQTSPPPQPTSPAPTAPTGSNAPPATPTASPPNAPNAPKLILETVAHKWGQLPFFADDSLKALLKQQHAAPLAVEGRNTIVVGLRGDANTRTLLTQPARQAALAQALSKLLGTPVEVRFKALPGRGEVDPEVLEQSPLAQVAVELGGKIVQAQPRKPSGGTHG